MRARKKRWFKRLLKLGGLFMLMGLGLAIGLGIGYDRGFHEARFLYGERYESPVQPIRQIREQIEIEIPPIPTIPPIPEIPEIPAIPEIPPIPDVPTIHIERGGHSFFDVVNAIGTILASFGLIGLGLVMVVRGRREIIKEKSPESLK